MIFFVFLYGAKLFSMSCMAQHATEKDWLTYTCCVKDKNKTPTNEYEMCVYTHFTHAPTAISLIHCRKIIYMTDENKS